MKRSPAKQRLWRSLFALSLALPLVTLSILVQTPELDCATRTRSAQLNWHKTTGTTIEFRFTFSVPAATLVSLRR